MSRYLKIAVTCAVMLAVALPALALENKINGYFWIQGITGSNYDNPNDAPATNFVDNRLRVKWTANVDENSGFVYYAEVDTPWGEPSKGSIGNGGKAGADGVNVETKNVYMFFKANGFDTKAGIQGINSGCDNTFIFQDAAALIVSKKFGELGTTFIWSKFNENTLKTGSDDLDVYGVKVAPALGSAKLDFGLFYINNNLRNAEQFTAAVEFTGKVAGLDLKAWLQAQMGDRVATGASGHDAVAMSAKISGAFGAARVIVYGASGQGFEDQSDVYEFPDTGLSIFMTDKFHNNGGQGALALKNAAYAGNGLFSLIYTGKQNIDKIYVDYAAGYFMALDDKGTEGTNLGLEVSAGVGTKVTEKVDLSLRGSYALLGDYYDAPAGGSAPDDPYKVVAMLDMRF